MPGSGREDPGPPEETFFGRLERWNLPTWLRPVAYPVPKIAGYEGLSVAVFEVGGGPGRRDGREPARGVFRRDGAAGAGGGGGVGAQPVPRRPGRPYGQGPRPADAEKADFAQTVDLLLHSLSGGADRALPWDRRVSLAAVLAQGQQVDLARMELMHCLSEDRRREAARAQPRLALPPAGDDQGFPDGDPGPAAARAHPRLLPPELRDSLKP